MADHQPATVTLPDHAIELLRQPNIAHFVTLMPDGSPHVSPVWIDVEDDGTILVNTAEGRVKPRNVRRDPRVAISMHANGDPYDILLVRGRAVEVTQEGAEDHIDFLSKKYTGVDRYPMHDPEHPRVLIRIRPEHVSGVAS